MFHDNVYCVILNPLWIATPLDLISFATKING